MWNKKMIKNAGVVAVILVCISIATSILGYSIKKNQSKTYFLTEKNKHKSDVDQNKKNDSKNTEQKQKNQKQVNIEGGITFEEAKKIALDYHIKHGGTKDDFEWNDKANGIGYKDYSDPSTRYYYIDMKLHNSDKLNNYEVYEIEPSIGKIICYGRDDFKRGVTKKEKVSEKVICDDANKLGYAPKSWNNIEKIYRNNEESKISWKNMNKEHKRILKQAYHKQYKAVINKMVTSYNLCKSNEYKILGAAVDSEIGTYYNDGDGSRAFCRCGILFNLRLKNGEELCVWFDQVTKELTHYVLYF